MRVLAAVLGLMFGLGVVVDAFQTIILPRRPRGRFRITRMFFLATWRPWAGMAQRIKSKRVREQVYSIYGPLSLLVLLVVWASLLVTGFGMIYFAMGTPFADALNKNGHNFSNFRSCFYVSGTTLFTLGLGDVTPLNLWARALVVLEGGTGLAFVALVIGYVPVIYQAFSRREVSVAMLDGRAGSPPTATELLRRHGYEGGHTELVKLLAEWERWSAEILESHISYPLLCYYRSQHDNQSWLSALVTILDSCALLITTIEGQTLRQAQLTFAMARHAVVDLVHVFHLDERAKVMVREDRLPGEEFQKLCGELSEMHLRLCGDPAAMERLGKIRALYEPQAAALGEYLRMPLPGWIPEANKGDQWKTIAALSTGVTLASFEGEEHG